MAHPDVEAVLEAVKAEADKLVLGHGTNPALEANFKADLRGKFKVLVDATKDAQSVDEIKPHLEKYLTEIKSLVLTNAVLTKKNLSGPGIAADSAKEAREAIVKNGSDFLVKATSAYNDKVSAADHKITMDMSEFPKPTH
ncbi:MAG: hypothetical protein A3E84_03095 [Gammaproteobacteria bacterium RIFCSPHIGHO2_12_FULL_42_13]|nr:MAG: hypothetical protein A3E84_03095 [Gammaproteobacteria bacterium RIFCSPHIGHO2_12_FULL_42_13]